MKNRTCSIDGCEGRADVPGTARGYCSKHYARWQRTGDPLGLLGRHGPQTATHKANISAALTGKKLSPEHIASFTTHGRTRDPNYSRHGAMMARCYSPTNWAYQFYGARGITVHEAWHDVATFCDWIAANLGPCPPGHSIDRIDNDCGYEPGNVRWATRSQQTINRRRIARPRGECVVCSAPFAATRSDAKYCSTRCQGTAQRRRNRARR
jgi:hypothetical protein